MTILFHFVLVKALLTGAKPTTQSSEFLEMVINYKRQQAIVWTMSLGK